MTVSAGRGSRFSATLARTAAATAAAAVVGSLAQRSARLGRYALLRKPSYQPPPVVFPIVWTLIYADIAVGSAVAVSGMQARGDDAAARSFQRALAWNLALNAGWTWVFFRAQWLWPAAGVAAALTGSSADLARRAATVDTRAAAGLSAYPAWCAFATVLSADIARRNR